MINKDAFSSFHPIINFVYFAFVLVFSMCLMNPACLLTSLACSIIYHIQLCGKKAVRFSLVYMLPLVLLTAIINPAFTHQGFTILMYLPDGNPLTLESIVYGFAMAFMLVCVIEWFACYTEVMTSDKFVYLFGRIIPAMSLVLSMTLRFIPKFAAQYKQVQKSQKCIGRDTSSGSIIQRIKNGATIISIMITWSLENAIETADSMRSRGYGLPGRTAFSIYKFDSRDIKALLWILACGIYIIIGWASKALYFVYYPGIYGTPVSVFNITFYIVYAMLCITPVLINIQEDRTWKRLRSEI